MASTPTAPAARQSHRSAATSRLGRAARFAIAYGVGVGAAIYTFTLGLGSRRHRGLIVEIGKHFGYRHNEVGESLPTVTPDSVADAGVAIVVPELLGTEGNVTATELVVLDRLVRRFGPRRLFEIGTFDGRTTVNLVANAPADAHVVTLDLPEDASPATARRLDPGDHVYIARRTVGARYRHSAWAGQIEQRFGDSAVFDFTPWVGTIDFVFVDASHAYEYVLSDSHRALTLLPEGKGVIVWHDYGSVWPGVTRALNELYSSGGPFAALRRIAGTTLAILVTAND
jgi:predicted O-methyltransferase YrrM